jgi:hypothetical protein
MVIRTSEQADRFRISMIPVDQAFFESEQRWGVGRLERLVSPSTLAAWQRGWSAYRVALDECDGAAVEMIGPKMVQALAVMSAEATAAGHQPLDVSTWEIELGNTGTVLVIARSKAEQSAVIRSANGKTFTAAPGGGLQTDVGQETTLPPDLAVTVRQQHEGRLLDVWCLDEIANLILAHGSAAREKGKWQGSPAHSGRQLDEGAAAEMARSGYPLSVVLTEPRKAPEKVALDF